MPPLYVLRTAARCPECGEAIHVFMLGCAAYHDAEDSGPVEDFHFLRRTSSVPDSVLTLLKAKCPGFFFDQEEGDPQRYLMNRGTFGREGSSWRVRVT